ncbi:MAG: glycosyltransferase family 39 protein, partial [Planctomycetota bacterium]
MQVADRKEVVCVVALLGLASATRLIGLDRLPAGVLPDELSNGYDAYSILQTGKDRWGQSWPILLEAFGRADHRPASYTYLVVPFVALLGPDHLVTATRLPAALCGIVTIAGLYGLVRRTCGRRVALVAALLLLFSPWHVQLSRFGAECSLTPLFPVLVLLVLSLAGWPLQGQPADPGKPVHLRWPWMAAFGLMLGGAPYIYASLKLFVPAMLVAGALVYRPVWSEVLRRQENRRALVVGALVGVVVSAPMVRLTLTQWETVNARAQDVSLFHQGLSPAVALGQCAWNWAAHFGPKWLFLQGPDSVLARTPGVGQLNWYMLPLLLTGLVVLWTQRKRNRIYGVLLAWLLLHPIASAATKDAPHILRAACGLGSFQWVAALGVGAWVSWSERRSWAGPLMVVILVACIAGNATWSLGRYHRHFSSNARLLNLWQADLEQALLSIRECWRNYDRVFISDHKDYAPDRLWMSDFPYIYVLVFLRIEPAEFHAWEKRVVYDPPTAPWHQVEGMGPFTLSTIPAVLDEFFQNHPDQRVLFVARPGDIHGGRLLDTVRDA